MNFGFPDEILFLITHELDFPTKSALAVTCWDWFYFFQDELNEESEKIINNGDCLPGPKVDKEELDDELDDYWLEGPCSVEDSKGKDAWEVIDDQTRTVVGLIKKGTIKSVILYRENHADLRKSIIYKKGQWKERTERLQFHGDCQWTIEKKIPLDEEEAFDCIQTAWWSSGQKTTGWMKISSILCPLLCPICLNLNTVAVAFIRDPVIWEMPWRNNPPIERFKKFCSLKCSSQWLKKKKSRPESRQSKSNWQRQGYERIL